MEPKRLRGTSFGTLRLIVGVWFQVLFHSPHWGSFHLSLTVLSSLSVTREYLALGGGPPRFPQGSTCPEVLGITAQGDSTPFAYGALTLYGLPFQVVRLGGSFVTPRPVRGPARLCPTTPSLQRPRAWHRDGLGSSPFARRYSGNRGCFLFLRVLRCFSSPGIAPPLRVVTTY